MKRTILLLFAAILCSASVTAQPAGFRLLSGAEKAGCITKLNDNVKTLQCSFRQEKNSTLLSETGESSGQMCYRKDKSLLRWEYTVPQATVLIIDDGKIKMNGESGKSKKAGKMFQELGKMISGVVSGEEFSSERNFKAEVYGTPAELWISMTPASRRVARMMKKLEITIDRKKMVATKMVMTEKNGDVTTIKFYRHKINEPVADELFQLK